MALIGLAVFLRQRHLDPEEDDMSVRIVVLLLTVVLSALTQPPRVSAQTGKGYRLGWVDLGQASTQLPPSYGALKARLAELGYVEGKNLTFEPRWTDGDYQRVPGRSWRKLQRVASM